MRSTTHSSFDWSCPPAPCIRPVCAAPAGPSWTLRLPLQAHPNRTYFSTLKSAPSSPVQGLRATTFSVELGARLCNLLGCPPHLSATAQSRGIPPSHVGWRQGRHPLRPPGPPSALRCFRDTLLCRYIPGDGCRHSGIRCGGTCSEEGSQVCPERAWRL